MADRKYIPAVKHTTPVGIARFPKLTGEPDTYQGGPPSWKTGLIFSAEDAAKVIAIIDAEMPKAAAQAKEAADAARSKGKKLKDAEKTTPYSEVVDPDTGTDTGEFLIQFKSSAEKKEYVGGKETGKVTRRLLPFFAANGVSIPENKKPALWGGSKLRISFSCNPYYMGGTNKYGVSLRIEAVKVIQAVSGGGGGDASEFGFGDAEEGYTLPEASSMGGDESDAVTSGVDGPGEHDF